MAETVNDVMDALLACACDALATADRPVCSCHAVIGQPMVGICCECEPGTGADPGVTGDLTIHLDRLYEADPNTLAAVSRVRPCKRGTVAASFILVLTRCYPTIDGNGERPDPDELDAAAHDLNDDAAVLFMALACCTGQTLRIGEVGVDTDPVAGCSILTARVEAVVSPRVAEQES